MLKNLLKTYSIWKLKKFKQAKTKPDFGISLKNINMQVNYGEILGVAGIAGNGQVRINGSIKWRNY
jgi:ABC-type uncharacterized transport system ATPase subunit